MILLIVCARSEVQAQQKWTVSTNAMSWLNLGTINAEGSLKLDRHFTVNAGFVANPWSITTPTHVEIFNHQYGGYVGAKYWPWNAFSEWWVGAKLQYKNFEQVGLHTAEMRRGNAVGAGVSAGYSMMISRHFNLDFGLGLWGGRIIKQKNFLQLDNVMVSIVYVF